jgi:predicted nucleotidyltransferase component of viral defense system
MFLPPLMMMSTSSSLSSVLGNSETNEINIHLCFIDAIFSVSACRDSLVFKGGTCLRKCYFHDYRFSEDLDFTSVNPAFVMDLKLLKLERILLLWKNCKIEIK